MDFLFVCLFVVLFFLPLPFSLYVLLICQSYPVPAAAFIINKSIQISSLVASVLPQREANSVPL